jgi:hypothetical protein
MIDVWPALPIIIRVDCLFKKNVDNVVAALERNDRVCEISIDASSYDVLEALLPVMQNPFPKLTRLFLGQPSFPFSDAEIAPVLSESFLGGSASRLQSFHLKSISFSTAPKFLSSATHLVHLTLRHTPPYGYFPPEAMVDCLSTLTRLEQLEINFQSLLPQSRPVRAGRPPPPRLRTVLPLLKSLYFRSGVEHIGEFCTRMQVPLLDHLHITYLNLATLDVRLILLMTQMFTGRTESFHELNQAHLYFNHDFIDVTLSPRNATTSVKPLKFIVTCRNSAWQLRSLTRPCHRFIPPANELERFDVCELEGRHSPLWADDTEDVRWLELLRLLGTVEDLYLSEGLALYVALALQEFTRRRGTGALHSLRNLFIEGFKPGPVQEAIAELVAARQRPDRPVDVQCWVRRSQAHRPLRTVTPSMVDIYRNYFAIYQDELRHI